MLLFRSTYNIIPCWGNELRATMEKEDKEGREVSEMQSAYNNQIDSIANRCTDDNTKNTITRLKSPRTPMFPAMKGCLKRYKDPMPRRSVISHVNAPMSHGPKWAATQLSSCKGIISQAPDKYTRDFYEKVRQSKAKRRLLSLDVKSLFTNISVNEAIEVVRYHATGHNPTFSLQVKTEIFCEILKLCLSFNQFSCNGKCYRQTAGVPLVQASHQLWPISTWNISSCSFLNIFL